MAVQQQQQKPPKQRTQPSIYLTFKVLQFVHSLRRRLKPRGPATASSSVLGSATCLGLESKALRSIAKGLSQAGVQQRKHFHHASTRVSKGRRSQNRHVLRPALKPQSSEQSTAAKPNASGDEVQHMLSSLDEKLSCSGGGLSAVAANDSLFLKQNNTPSFEACSLNETVHFLILVHEAINVLYACRSQYDDEWLVAQGLQIGLNIDDAFIANYEHLLIRLRAELIDVLARKVLEALLLGGHDKTQRRLLNWFTEFSDKPRPLSTFPWTIKPSLAVLWGVCWMFYNSAAGSEGNHRVPQARFLGELPQWSAPGSSEYLLEGLELTGTQPQPAAQQPFGGDGYVGRHHGVDLRLRNTASMNPPHLEYARQANARPRRPRATGAAASRAHATAPRSSPAGLGQLLGPGESRLVPRTSPTLCSRFQPVVPKVAYPRVGPSTYYPQFRITNDHAVIHEPNPLPCISGQAPTSLTVFPLGVDSLNQSWHSIPPSSSLPQSSARHLTSTPSIRVTGSADTEPYAQPQSDFASNLFAPIYQPQQPQAPPNINTDFDYHFIMGNCQPPEQSPIQHPGPRHERTSSVNSNSNIPTPVSMSGPRSPMLSPVGDRRHSVASSRGHIRSLSDDASSVDGDDGGSPRRNHAFKRAEEPPRNLEGKMVCKHKECADATFDRKCEWSKHMDKHDRPYKCNVKGCEKLQGFTYSGGLLRHEREVHKMHGGTKKSLFCPFTDCKRSSGSGFTRKENLAEHIRRVHRRTSMSADLGSLIIHRSDTTELSTADVRLPSDSPYQRIVEVPEDEDTQISLKRKRVSDAGLSEHGDEELRAEIKRLRRENEDKDARLRQLEQAVMALQQRR